MEAKRFPGCYQLRANELPFRASSKVCTSTRTLAKHLSQLRVSCACTTSCLLDHLLVLLDVILGTTGNYCDYYLAVAYREYPQ